MQSNHSKRSGAYWARGFAALCAALTAAAAGGSALAGPVETVLYTFTGGSDGAAPQAGLIADSSGNLYGAAGGGASNAGVVFKLSPGGTETVLHTFTGFPSDGTSPTGLIADSSGNLYGTTEAGGASRCPNIFGDLVGCGVVFKLSPSGTETVLYSFTGRSFTGRRSDGANPFAGLIADSSGNLYGTTNIGGASGTAGASGKGTVFKLSPGGTETVLYSFTGRSDGGQPRAGLIADSSGNLYGTTSRGGVSGSCIGAGCGVVFKLSPSGTETVLHSFTGAPSDGAFPGGLIADSNGNLYGTTAAGGVSGFGAVFKLSPSGTETVLHSFTGSDGGVPNAGLIADSNGNLYGTTASDGTTDGGGVGAGVVFKLTGTGFVPPIPFSAFSPKLTIHFGTTPNHDSFDIPLSFTLGSASNGINPAAEPVTLQIGTFTTTIPTGSFKGTEFGPFTFEGVSGSVALKARIALTGTKRYAFEAAAQNANLTGTVNPVPVTLTIGDDSGTTSVTAVIASGLATAH